MVLVEEAGTPEALLWITEPSDLLNQTKKLVTMLYVVRGGLITYNFLNPRKKRNRLWFNYII